MKIFIRGDHSRWHCGSKAVTEYLRYLVTENNFELIDNPKYADCIIINGEGGLHGNSVIPGRKDVNDKLRQGAYWKDKGKPVHLINTVWQNMGGVNIDYVKKFDTVIVRDQLSYDELKQVRQDIDIHIDISYDSPIDLPKSTYETPVIGGFYNPVECKWENIIPDYKRINIREYDEWQDYINDLSVASFLVSGFHHEAVAAMKLRIPFIAYRGNTDKVLGIIMRAKADIPVACTPEELLFNMNNPPHQREYDKLFDFLERQKPFDLADIGLI